MKRRSTFCSTLAAITMVWVWATPPDALAQQPPTEGERTLEDVERRLQEKQAESERLKAEASALKSEVTNLNQQLIDAARRVQNQESRLNSLEDALGRLNHEMQLKEQTLNHRREQFSGVVMALTRMSRVPTEALIVQPMTPNEMVRSAILLKAAVPTLESQASLLRKDLDALSAARKKVEAQKTQLASVGDLHIREQAKLEILVKRKVALRAEAISKNRAALSQMRALAKKATTLRELMGRLEEAAAPAETAAFQPSVRDEPVYKVAPSLGEGAIQSITRARGKLPFPAVGETVGRYGEKLGDGASRKGLSIQTRPGAQVVAPFDGKVVFSGPFRGYGQLLIIDHGEGYHTLLAGLGRIDSSLGSPVLAGEPVASMEEAASEDPVLYIELRRNNEPVNPLPWLSAEKGSTQE